MFYRESTVFAETKCPAISLSNLFAEIIAELAGEALVNEAERNVSVCESFFFYRVASGRGLPSLERR